MSIPVVAIFDVGKTNKKLFLFDEHYHIVFEKSARLIETVDEDGDPCENLESLHLSLIDSLSTVNKLKEFDVKAVNFSAYGASFVHIDEDGNPLGPLYNYLKAYPEEIKERFYQKHGSEAKLARETASPALGNLNSGLQLYRIKQQQPELFKKIKYSLHLPQYLSYLLTKKACTDITSIGCHTALWDFDKNDYHDWVYQEGLAEKFAPIAAAGDVFPGKIADTDYVVGIGLHDSSAALIPYLVNFTEPFILISTGTWCISLNPFNHFPLTVDELKSDCLCYLQYQGKPVKASRIFAGFEHEQQVKRIAEHFGQDEIKYKNIEFDPNIIKALKALKAQFKPIKPVKEGDVTSGFGERDLDQFDNDIAAYHQFMLDLVGLQVRSLQLILPNTGVNRIFVDGGFSKNNLYMNLLAASYPGIEVFGASMAQASAVGAALTIHKEWNSKAIPNNLIELKYYSSKHAISI
jgi:sugar (pentulose or hexulose) kinase